MAGRNPKKSDSWPFWTTTVLLPVPKGVNTDAEGVGKLVLCEAHERSQNLDIGTGFEAARHQTSTNGTRHRTLEVGFTELRNISHHLLLEYRWKKSVSRAVAHLALMILTMSSSLSVQTTRTTPRMMGPIAMNRSS